LDCGSDGCGWGESAPRPYVTGENVRSVIALWEHVFAPVLFTHAFDGLEDVDRMLSHLETACLRQGHRAFHSALGAADLGLIDLLRQSGRMKTADLLPTLYRDTLRYSVSVPFIDPAVIEKFFPILNEGFDNPIIKILIGEDSEDNFRRLQQLRRLAGVDAEIRLEVNGRLDPDRVLPEIDRLRPFHPSAIEQPLPAGDVEGLRRLRADSGLAVVVDESLISLANARALIAGQACDIFNIKISKCGGLLRSRAIAQLAAQAGVTCQIGTHVGESELLAGAGIALAMGIPNFDCYGGGSHVLFSRLFDDYRAAPATIPSDDARRAWRPRQPFSPQSAVIRESSLCLDLMNPSN
jgi:muconate cycloisomerase